MNKILKILIVCSGNIEDENLKTHHAFVFEQIESVKKNYQIDYDTLLIKGKGIFGYLKNLSKIKKKIREYKPDLIHAHYGLSGLLSNMQRAVPVVITFHGSEILSFIVNLLSSFSAMVSKYNIYVARHIREKMYYKPKKNYKIIPCGINLFDSKEVDKQVSLLKMNLVGESINIVFGGAFDVLLKNSALAKAAIQLIPEKNINLIELKGYNRTEVTYLLNACDLLLLPSKSEGSPQTIKEAMACNCPIVATDVGDIKEILSDTEGCFITSFEPEDVAEKIRLAIKFAKRTNGREKIKKFDNNLISEKIYSIYNEVLNKSSDSLQIKHINKFEPLSLLFGTHNSISFWDEKQNKIIESLVHDKEWNFYISDSAKYRYKLFGLSTVLIAKSLFKLNTDLYDENIIKYVKHIIDNLPEYSKSDLSYGGLTNLIVASELYDLPDNNIKEIGIIFDSSLDEVIKDCDNQDSLILIAGKYINDIIPNINRLKKLKFLTDKYLNSQNKKGYFETGDIRAIYHQRNMYVLWGLIFASYFYTEKVEEIKNAVRKNLNWAWDNNRDKQDDAIHWHPAFYWIKNKYGIKIPILNIKSSKYLFECHQTFFANAINFYQLRFNTFEFQLQKERAIEWIYGNNRIHKDLTTISGLGLPIRIMNLNGDLFIKDEQFKGSYEVGSYIMALAAEKYFKENRFS
jgi:glycosyltransferase involved in cell wall biosynthesis